MKLSVHEIPHSELPIPCPAAMDSLQVQYVTEQATKSVEFNKIGNPIPMIMTVKMHNLTLLEIYW
jgi:hypothetical protein